MDININLHCFEIDFDKVWGLSKDEYGYRSYRFLTNFNHFWSEQNCKPGSKKQVIKRWVTSHRYLTNF